MIKSVTGAIPTYAMVALRIPNGLCDEIEKIQNIFWWKTSDTEGIHWLSWEQLAIPKAWGGMGFKLLVDFNTTMLAKYGWRLLIEKSLAYTILKAKYFPNTDFMGASLSLNGKPSVTWRSIMSAQELLRAGCRRTVGSGKDINIWIDP